MFAEAYKKATAFTYPLIVSMRYFDGSVECGMGTFVVLNRDGWVVTAAHLFQPKLNHQTHSKEIAEYERKVEAIRQDEKLATKAKQKKVNKLKTNPKWISNVSYYWGLKGISTVRVKGGVLANLAADIAAVQLEGIDFDSISTYPTFKDPSCLAIGTSLCKLGFPFHKIEAEYIEEEGIFKLAPNALPAPWFPIEGIYTRNVLEKKGNNEAKFIETSSPGLRGQSGGPIFDTKGTVWGIQIKTRHFDLGFNPKVKKNGREVEENQFLSVGLGVHPEELIPFLRDNGIDFELSDY